MEEKEIQHLVKQTLRSAPAGLADRVMSGITAEEHVVVKKPVYKLRLLYAACFLLMLLSFIVSIPEINFLDFSVTLSSTVITVLSVLFVIYETYRLRELREKLNALTKMGV